MIGFRLFCATPLSFGVIAIGSTSVGQPVFAPLPPEASAHTALIGPLDETPTTTGAPRAKHIRRASDGLFYVTAVVNGAKVRFLLDTGANMVVLTRADAKRAGVRQDASAGADDDADTMETAGGSSAIDRVTLDRVSIAGRSVRGVDAAVVRRGLGVSLLGQNLLARLGPVTISGNSVSLD